MPGNYRSDGYDNEVTDKRKKRGLISGLVVTGSVLTLSIMAINNWCPPIDKVYSPNSYYGGKISGEDPLNPKDVYNQMVLAKGGSVNATDCTVTTKKYLTGSALWLPGAGSRQIAWPVLSDQSGTYGDSPDIGANYNKDSKDQIIETANENNGYLHWYIWTKQNADMQIISPWSGVEFLNANIDDPTVIKVRPIGGGKTSSGEERWIEFHNVANWFCHINDKKAGASHTIRIGSNPDSNGIKEFPDDGSGWPVIGKATAETYMVGKRKTANGAEEECSPYYAINTDVDFP